MKTVTNQNYFNQLACMIRTSLPRTIAKVTLLGAVVMMCCYYAYAAYLKHQTQSEIEALTTVPESSKQEAKTFKDGLDLAVLSKSVITLQPKDLLNLLHLNVDLQFMNQRIKLFVDGDQQLLGFLAQMRFKTHQYLELKKEYFHFKYFIYVLGAFAVYLFIFSILISILLNAVSKFSSTSKLEHIKLNSFALNTQVLISLNVLFLGIAFITAF